MDAGAEQEVAPMTPLERTARVLAELAEPEIGPFDGGVDAVWPSYVSDAKRVFQAIREPSEAMVQDGDEAGDRQAYVVNGAGDDAVFSMGGSKTVWQTMIDAALEEG